MLHKTVALLFILTGVALHAYASDLNQNYRDYLQKLPPDYYSEETIKRSESGFYTPRNAGLGCEHSDAEADLYQEESERFCTNLNFADLLRLRRCGDLLLSRYASLCGTDDLRGCPKFWRPRDERDLRIICERAKKIGKESREMGDILEICLRATHTKKAREQRYRELFAYTVAIFEGRVPCVSKDEKWFRAGHGSSDTEKNEEQKKAAEVECEKDRKMEFTNFLLRLPPDMEELYAELYQWLKDKGYDQYLNRNATIGESLLDKYPKYRKPEKKPAEDQTKTVEPIPGKKEKQKNP